MKDQFLRNIRIQIEAFGEFLLALILLHLGNDDFLAILDDKIRLVVGVFSFEGEDSRGDHSVRQLVGFDAKIPCHAAKLFRPAFHFLASLRSLLNLKDDLQICFHKNCKVQPRPPCLKIFTKGCPLRVQ